MATGAGARGIGLVGRGGAALLALALGGCLGHLPVAPIRLDPEPPGARQRGAVGLAVAPGVAEAELLYRNPWLPHLTARPRFAVPVGAEVVIAWERLLGLRFERVVRVEGTPPPGLVGLVELGRVEPSDGPGPPAASVYRVEVGVTSLVRDGAGRPVTTLAVRGRGEAGAVTVPGGLAEATGLAVKQAADLFQRALDEQPELAAWAGGVAEAAATPTATPLLLAPAPATPPPPPPGSVTLTLFGWLGGGLTDMVNRRSDGALDLGVACLVGPGRVGVGLAGTLGLRAGVRHWSGALAGGAAFQPRPRLHLDLLGELGFLAFDRAAAQDGLFSADHIRGGAATLPYAGLRLLARYGEGPAGVGIGLWAQATLGSATAKYTIERCPILGACTITEHELRYGGWAAGLLLSVGGSTQVRGSPPEAARAPDGGAAP